MSRYLSLPRTGAPAEVLELACRDLAPLQHHEVRVEMHFAPINPADINFIEGTYGKQPRLPSPCGMEGAGRVIEIGPEVQSLAVGDAVMPLHGGACWAQHLTLPEHQLAKLPTRIDLAQASMLRINPITAARLLDAYVDLDAGEWLAQNAANSGVGRSLIQIAKARGLHTLNLVRRAELVDELTTLGADAVVLDSDDGLAQAREIVQGKAPRLAGNAVGSDSAIRLMDLLAPEGHLVTYGAMSRRSMKVPNKFLIFKNLHLCGLWVTRWLEHASHSELYGTLHPLAEMMAGGSLKLAVDAIVPLSDYRDAIALAMQEGRKGKVLLDLRSL
jgi:mitochondrial enoyl-[acyl-carrier protein] reductase / trans-2-enoyl-CoA reductase